MHEHKYTKCEAIYSIKSYSYNLYLSEFYPIQKINNIFMLYELFDDDINIEEKMIFEDIEILNNGEFIDYINTNDAPINRIYNHDLEDPTEKQIIYKISLNSLINRFIILNDSKLSIRMNFNKKIYKYLACTKIIVEGIKYDNINEVIVEPLTITHKVCTINGIIKRHYLQTGNKIEFIEM